MANGNDTTAPSEINPLTGLPVGQGRKTTSLDKKVEAVQGSAANVYDFNLAKGESLSDYVERGVDIYPSVDLDKQRARLQSGWDQMGNAIVGGIGKGLLTLVENIGYIGDVAEWTGAWDEEDASYTNWLSEMAKSGKESIDESLPIFRQNPNATWDVGDGAWWWSNVQGLIDSGIGFGGTGALAGAGLRGLGALTNLQKIGATGESLVTSLGAGSAMNYAESKMMSVELFKTSYEELVSQGIDEAEASEIAAKNANEFIWANKVNILTDAMAMHSAFRGKNWTRNLQSSKLVGKGRKARTLTGDALKEGFEEISAGALQQEFEYQSLAEAGLSTEEYEDSFLGRALDYSMSGEGMLEFTLGLAGGPVQKGIASSTYGRVGKKARVEHHRRQEEQAQYNEEHLASILNEEAGKIKEMQGAYERGNDDMASSMQDNIFSDLAYKNFENGTTEYLKKQLQDISSLSSEEAQVKGYGEDYREIATDNIEKLDLLEKEYIKTRKKLNAPEDAPFRKAAYGMTVNRRLAQEQLKKVTFEKEELLNSLRGTAEAEARAEGQKFEGFSAEVAVIDARINSVAKERESLIARRKDELILEKSGKVSTNKKSIAKVDKKYNKSIEALTKQGIKLKGEKIATNKKIQASDEKIKQLKLEDYSQHDDIQAASDKEVSLRGSITHLNSELAKVNNPKKRKEILAELEKAKESFKKEVVDEASQEAEDATTPEAENAARENAKVVDPTSNKVDKAITQKNRDKSKGATAINPSKLKSSLEARYKDNPELLASELNLINEELDAANLPKIPSTLDTSEKLAKVLTSHKNIGSPLFPIVMSFYDSIEIEGSTIDNIENEQEDEIDNTVSDSKEGQITPSSDPEGDAENIIRNRQYEYIEEEGETLAFIAFKDRLPIVADDFLKMTKEDWEYINNPNNLKIGEQVTLEVDLDDSYNKKLKKGTTEYTENYQIKIVKTVNGNKRTLGILSAHTTDPKLLDIRSRIEGEIGNKTSGVFTSKTKLSVKKKFNGNYLNSTDVVKVNFDSLHNPSNITEEHKVSNSHGEVLVGYASSKNGVHLLEVPNSKEKIPVYDNVVPGALYMLIQSGNGTPVPVRLKTRQINKEEQKAVGELISQMAIEKEQAKTERRDYTTKEWTEIADKIKAIAVINVKPSKLGSSYVNVGGKDIDMSNLIPGLGSFLAQVDAKSLNTKGYNESVLGDKLRVNLNLENPIANTNFSVELDTTIITPEATTEKSSDLQQAKRVKAPRVGPRKRPSIGKPTKKFRKATPYRVEKWDSATELAWLGKKLPFVEAKVLKDLHNIHKVGGVEAWGLFANAMIYIQENAGTGTAYHEGFHAVFNLMLSDKERRTLLLQAQTKYGLQDDIELEEAMADEFMNYVIANEATKPYKGTWLGRLFSRIMRMFDIVNTKRLTIDSVFEDINSGRYNNKLEGTALKRNVAQFKDETRFKIPGMNPIEKRERVSMLSNMLIKNLESLSSEEAYSDMAMEEIVAKRGLVDLSNEVYEEINNIVFDLIDYKAEWESALEGDYEYIVDQYDLTSEYFATLFDEALRQLPSHGLNYKKSNKQGLVEDLYEDLEDEHKSIVEGWQHSTFEASTKETVTDKVKQLLSRIPNVDTEGKVINDSVGYPTYLPYDEVFNDLKRTLTNIYSFSEMKDKMKSMTKQKPYYAEVIKVIESDTKAKSSFFSAMSTQAAKFALVLRVDKTQRMEDGTLIPTSEYVIIDSNRKSPEKIVIANWQSNFENRILVGANISKKGKDIVAKIKGNLESKKVNKASISSNLSELGFDFPLEILENFDNNEFKEFSINLKVVLNTIEKGKNPFEEEGSSLKALAGYNVAHNLDIYEQSFKNVENKIIFSNILPNHISKTFSKLTKDNETIDWYQKDAFYKRNKWLNDLRENDAKELFSYVYLDGLKVQGQDKGTKYTGMSSSDLTTTKVQMFNNQGNKNVAYYSMPILADAPQSIFIKFNKYSNEEALEGLYEIALQEYERNAWADKNDLEVKNFKDRKVYMPFVKDATNKEATIESIKANLLIKEASTTLDTLEDFGLIIKKEDGTYSITKQMPVNFKEENIEEFVKNYVYNTTLANFNIGQIFSGDLAFYKNVEDFAKRNKQVSNPGRALDTSDIGATYNTIYVNDEVMPSVMLGAYSEALEGNPKREAILSQYNDVNGTDAQAYISLDRYRDILTGVGMWSDKHEAAYPRLKSGKGNTEDIGLFLQPIKPFYFGKIFMKGKIVPTQNKNSEYVVLPQMAEGNPKMQAMLDKFDEGIASIQFVSAVKVGIHNNVSFDNLGKATPIELFNDDYSIQLDIPEHHVDTSNLFGTQIRKLVISDLVTNLEHKYNVKDAQLNPTEIFDTYQDIISADINSAYDSLAKMMESPKELQKLLLEEVKSRDLGIQLEQALELNENDEFIHPLFHPLHSKRNESLMNSLFKNRVTKQKIRGAALVQVSDYALSDRLVVNIEKGKLKSVQARLPHYSKKYFKPFMDENGDIDMEAIREQAPELLEAISYRIPTEDKYSMLPIEIVGFSPSIAGGTIMLPADITKVTGADFDIDKMFIMFNSFEMVEDKPKYISYDYSKPAAEQSKAARDNGKIDIIKGILTDKNNFENWITPGGFDNLSRNKEEITALKPATDALNVGLQSTYLELFNRNMSGLDLIGIYANHNVNHSLTQHTDIGFTDAIKFDGNSRNMLNVTEDTEGNRISRTLAEFLAAAVDNAKDPVAGELNINTFTADIVASIIRVGYPLETALYLVNQPIILQLAQDHFNSGAKRSQIGKLINEAKKNLIAKGANAEIEGRKNFNLNTDVLKKNISLSTDNLSDKEADHQLTVLSVFDKLQSMGDDLGKLVRGLRADSVGAGPTMSANSLFLSNVEATKINPGFLPGTVEKAFTDYKMAEEFTDKGIRKAQENLSNYFPWDNPLFSTVRNSIASDIKGIDLTAEEMEFANYALLSYLASDFEFFNLRTEDYSKLITKLPATYKSKLDSDPILSNLFLTKLLAYENVKGVESIKFNTNSKLSTLQKERLTEDFEYLLANDKYRALGEDLIKYSYAVSGFRFTPSSFNHLIPMSFYNSLSDETGQTFNDFIKDKVETAAINGTSTEFVDKFIRNFYYKFDFLPAVNNTPKLKNISGIKRADNGIPMSIKIDNNSDSDIKGAPYIKYEQGGKTYLFGLTNLISDASNIHVQEGTYIYNVVLTLGLPNRVNELSTSTAYSAFEKENSLRLKLGGKMVNYNTNDVSKLQTVLAKNDIEVNKYFYTEENTVGAVEPNIVEETSLELFGAEENLESTLYNDSPTLANPSTGQNIAPGNIAIDYTTGEAYIFDVTSKSQLVAKPNDNGSVEWLIDTEEISKAQFKLIENLCK